MYLVFNLRVYDEAGFLGFLVDISEGGIKLLSDYPLMRDEPRALSMKLPLRSGDEGRGRGSIDFVARCQWSRLDGSGGDVFMNGFRIEALDLESRTLMETVMADWRLEMARWEGGGAHEKKRVLVALGADGGSADLLRYALDIARRMDAEVYPLHAIGDPVWMSAFGDACLVWEDFTARAVCETTMKTALLVRECGADRDSVNPVVEMGDTASCITRAANMLNADLIVVGNHRHGGGRQAAAQERVRSRYAACESAGPRPPR